MTDHQSEWSLWRWRPHSRSALPFGGASTLMTSAPKSASSVPTYGPAMSWPNSTARRPVSGPSESGGVSVTPDSYPGGRADQPDGIAASAGAAVTSGGRPAMSVVKTVASGAPAASRTVLARTSRRPPPASWTPAVTPGYGGSNRRRWARSTGAAIAVRSRAIAVSAAASASRSIRSPALRAARRVSSAPSARRRAWSVRSESSATPPSYHRGRGGAEDPHPQAARVPPAQRCARRAGRRHRARRRPGPARGRDRDDGRDAVRGARRRPRAGAARRLLRRPQRPRPRPAQHGRRALAAGVLRALRRAVLAAGQRHLPLCAPRALREARRGPRRRRLAHVDGGGARDARDRRGGPRRRGRDGGSRVRAERAAGRRRRADRLARAVGPGQGRHPRAAAPPRRARRVGRIFEFTGPGVATLTATERGTIANMIVETGGSTAGFPARQPVPGWAPGPGPPGDVPPPARRGGAGNDAHEGQGRAGDFRALAADDGAEYDEIEEIDLGALEPLIARPSSPGDVVPVAEIAGTEVAQVCVGSSVNSSYEDLALVGAVLKDRIVHERVQLTVTPGSRQILDVM